MNRRSARLGAAGALAFAALSVAACSSSPSEPGGAAAEAQLLSVTPNGGATDVSPTGTVRIEFDHPMADGTEEYCTLHVGGLDGADVPGAWMWSDDHMVATFTPGASLDPDTEYTFHLGGGIMDADGHHVDFSTHGPAMGGMHVDDGMMGGGMMGGSEMGGMWQGPDGGYGMMFQFRTGS